MAAYLKTGTHLRLGSLDARRDSGHPCGYFEAMWPMLTQPAPTDCPIGTAISRSLRYLVEPAFGLIGLDWRDHVHLDPAYVRPTEVPNLLADSSEANRELGGTPDSASTQ